MRETDDLQPRIQIKKVVKEDDLPLDESLEKFSKTYIVERPLVIKCLKQAQKRITSIKSLFQKLKSIKSYKEFDWLALKTIPDKET